MEDASRGARTVLPSSPEVFQQFTPLPAKKESSAHGRRRATTG
jgi:hypothetical protein